MNRYGERGDASILRLPIAAAALVASCEVQPGTGGGHRAVPPDLAATPSFTDFDRRAREGGRLNVVFFGASLTWGANATDQGLTSYRAVVAGRLRERYPQAHLSFYDGAIGRTGSQTGVFRLERDCLRHEPDLVFLDFSANDDIYSDTPETLASYESLVRRIVTDGKCPVVVMVFPFKWNVEQGNTDGMKGRDAHLEIAKAYGAPVGDAITDIIELVKSGETTTAAVWPHDGVHPGDAGYALFADSAMKTFSGGVARGAECRAPEKMLHADTYMRHARVRISSLISSPSASRGSISSVCSPGASPVAITCVRCVFPPNRSDDQPVDGKMSVVIEDETGWRVRNLISGVKAARGRRDVEWDGLTDDGNLVKPGTYRWRSVHHPGIRPEYLFSFANGDEDSLRPFGPNHNIFEDATATAKYAFLAAPSTEGGNALIAVGDDGKLVRGYKKAHGTGLYNVAVAADDKWLYVANDGPGWGQRIDRKKKDWKASIAIVLTRYDVNTSRMHDYPGGKHFAKVAGYEYGPGSSNPNLKGTTHTSLRGMALLDGTLYVSARHAQGIIKIDPATAKETARFPLPEPGAVCVARGSVFAISGRRVVRVDPDSGRLSTIVRDAAAEPRGLAVDGSGNIYVSDGATHTIRVFSSGGRLVKSLGTPGGPYSGKYDPDRLIKPTGLAVFGNKLWVTEERRNPKRAVAFDLARGKVAVMKYGTPPYGGPAASFDPKDHTRWLGLRCQWKLDFEAKTAICTHVSQEAGGHLDGKLPWSTHYRFHRQDGRTFLIGMDKTTLISELMPDGTVRDLAGVSSCHTFSYQCHWKPPREFIEAFEKAFPDRKGKHSDKGPGVLWVDRDGDGSVSSPEFSFTTKAKKFAGSGWGHDMADLTLRVPVTRADGTRAIAVLKPRGFLPGGAPDYPTLDEAVAAAVPLKREVAAYDYKSIHVSSSVDRFGNMVMNTDPEMVCYSPGGELLWRYPNRWSNVHGSHKAPLPEVGVTQGILFYLGMAPLDDASDVFIAVGNHGRFFCMTTDGMYLDEMFSGVRVGAPRDEFYIGGEAFGGSFGKAEDDGNYYLQVGGSGYRIYRLRGLDEVARAEGTLEVTPQQLMAAERKLARREVAAATKREATIMRAAGRVSIDSGERDLPKPWTVEWKKSEFLVRVKCAYDEANLYLYYDVRDRSPWVNNGDDWQTLFKSGDSVDLQIGTDPAADPDRKGPAPGDVRLLVAPYQDSNIAVLYRHRVAKGPKDPVTFSSPWRSEIVDEVRRLESARIKVDRGDIWYRVKVIVPLAELGLREPAGKAFRADFGVLYGDPAGTQTGLRSYWSNQATMLVSDVPGEIMLFPARWGVARFEGR
ncbi:MAG: GDSL-type esterase/lipase family protein [Planctomycetota bacterium]